MPKLFTRLEYLNFEHLRLFRISPACAKSRLVGRRQGFNASNLPAYSVGQNLLLIKLR
jgi:hypothetical protein